MSVPARPLPVVFLHSAGATPQMWQSQVEALAEAQGTQAEMQVIAPWLAGLRPGRPAELSLSGAAAEVVSQLDRYGIEQARLVGHQLGAMVALEVAAGNPDRVASLVLSGAFAAPGKLALRLQKSLIRLLPNSALGDSGATKDDLIRALELMAGSDLAGNTGSVTVPVLVIAGSSDPGLAAARELVRQFPNARLAELPGVGANPAIEAAEAFNQLLVDFIIPAP